MPGGAGTRLEGDAVAGTAFTHGTSCPSRHRRTSPRSGALNQWVNAHRVGEPLRRYVARGGLRSNEIHTKTRPAPMHNGFVGDRVLWLPADDTGRPSAIFGRIRRDEKRLSSMVWLPLPLRCCLLWRRGAPLNLLPCQLRSPLLRPAARSSRNH
jgi:hypothetical protein